MNKISNLIEDLQEIKDAEFDTNTPQLRIKIMFDVDDTLIDFEGNPIQERLILLEILQKMENVEVGVWSGGGRDYAKKITTLLGLNVPIYEKSPEAKADICFDDQDVDLAKINIKVPKILTNPS